MVTNSSKPGNVELDNMPSMEQLLEQTAKSTFQEGRIISGKVAEKRDNGVLLDIGYKAEGFVDREEFRDWASLAVGQAVDVYIEEIEDEDSMPVLSVRKAELQKAWDNIVLNYKEGGNIRGMVRHRVKGWPYRGRRSRGVLAGIPG